LLAIVEGHGEVRAVPALMRQWLRLRGLAHVLSTPDLAMNAKGCGRLKAEYDRGRQRGVEHYVQQALRRRPLPAGILAILDADDECLKRGPDRRLGPELLARAESVAGPIPVAVVVAHREFEAWLLADLAALREDGRLRLDGKIDESVPPEERPGCKSAMGTLLGASYEPTVHQWMLARALRFSDEARAASRSFDKLVRELERLTAAALAGSAP
jgi:hypothetical protein